MPTGKKRGAYDKSPRIKDTYANIANDIAECLRRDIALSVFDKTNFSASMNALINAEPAIQRCVLAALKPPHGSRRRKRNYSDEDILSLVEYMKAELAEKTKRKVTDIVAIEHCLESGFLRIGRLTEIRFDRKSIAGKHEIDRVKAAIGRARKARESKIPPT